MNRVASWGWSIAAGVLFFSAVRGFVDSDADTPVLLRLIAGMLAFGLGLACAEIGRAGDG